MIKKRIILFFLLLINFLYGDNILIIYDNFAIVNKDTTIQFQQGSHKFSLYNLPKRLSPESFYLSPIKDITFKNIEFTNFLKINNNEPAVTVYSKGNVFKGKLKSKDPLSILTSDNIIITFKDYDRFEFKNNKEKNKYNVFTISYNSKANKKEKINYKFDISGISWQALYNLFIINEENTENVIFDLNCKIKIENNSGASFKNYFVKLFSGDLNKQNPPNYYTKNRIMMAAGHDMAEHQLTQDNISEYYIYSLNKKVDIAKNKINFFDLLNSSKIKGKKSFFYEPYKNDKKVVVKYTIINNKKNNLGIALPCGKIKLFKKEKNADIQIGKDKIAHTPKDENIEIISGFAYDIKANKILKNKKKLDKNTYQYDYEITITNHKKSNIKVNIKEWFSGQVFIKSSNYNFKKLNSNTYLCSVKIQPNSFEKIFYTVVQTY